MALLICCCFLHNTHAQINARIVPSAQQVRDFAGSSQVKLVFVNGLDSAAWYVYYVDFSESAPVFHKIAATQGAWNTSISPDGNYVAYSTGAEGTPAVSAWVCRLAENATPVLVTQGRAHEPRFVKDTAARQVIYQTTWQTGDWNGLGQTMIRGITGSGPSPRDSVLYAAGSFHCGLSVDKRYLATTMFEPNPRMADLATGAVYTLHSLLCKNKTTQADTVINPQACNGSVSSSGIFTNVMLYMDFGIPSQYTHQVLGSWGFHQRIFAASTAGDIIRWYDFPDSLLPVNHDNVTFGGWTHSEWSVNHPYYGVASNLVSRYFQNGGSYETTELCEDVYAINLKTATYLKLVESTDNSLTSTTHLEWPGLWIQLPASFTEDTTWLANQSAVRQNRVHGSGMKRSVWISGHTVWSREPIAGVEGFDVEGRLIFGKKYDGGVHSIRLEEIMPVGICIVQIETESRRQLLKCVEAR
ncbi:MAG TPA: hypothetical protein VLX68_15415 [Chitinivibrionales bacterium]|nr:hypothetical protein [Chitinivibrionales bacterium]